MFLFQEDLIFCLYVKPDSDYEHGSVSSQWMSSCVCRQGKRGWSSGQNNKPALHPAPPLSPPSRASIKASCPALIFWTGLARILSARQPDGVIQTESVSQRTERKCDSSLNSLLTQTSFCLPHASSILLPHFVLNLPVYHSLLHTQTLVHKTGRR